MTQAESISYATDPKTYDLETQSASVRRADYLTPAHGRRNLLDIGVLYAGVLTWMVAGANFLPLWAFIPLSLIICGVQQRQLAEWLHEGVHYNIHPNRKINEAVSKWVLAASFGIPLSSMRAAHFSHHAAHKFFDERDMDTAYAAIFPGQSVWRGFLSDLCGLTAIKAYAGSILPRLKKDNGSEAKTSILSTIQLYIPVAIVQIIYIASSAMAGHFYIWILYYISLVTVYPVLSRLRLYAQHLEVGPDGNAVLAGSGTTRTIKAGFLERMIIQSRLMQYHFEHHVWPHLPYRALETVFEPVANNQNRYTTSHSVVFKALSKGVK